MKKVACCLFNRIELFWLNKFARRQYLRFSRALSYIGFSYFIFTGSVLRQLDILEEFLHESAVQVGKSQEFLISPYRHFERVSRLLQVQDPGARNLGEPPRNPIGLVSSG